jgi:hypothetical protein
LGDMNARLLHQQPAEEQIIGTHIYNPTREQITNMFEEKQDNRSRFMEAMGRANMVVMNTWFQKSQEDLLTYRPPGIKDFNEDIDTSNYAQIDHIAAKKSWRNTIKNIRNIKHTLLNSDHTCRLHKFR